MAGRTSQNIFLWSKMHENKQLYSVGGGTGRSNNEVYCSQELCDLGVVSGADLTVEAALTKLSYLLGRTDLSVDAVREVH